MKSSIINNFSSGRKFSPHSYNNTNYNNYNNNINNNNHLPFYNSMYIKNNNNLLNNNNMTVSQGSYHFPVRKGPLKWKELLKLDLEYMIKKGNLSPLEEFLENLIFASIEENDLNIVSEEHVCKLVKMYQHLLEYTIYTQKNIEGELLELENMYKDIVEQTSLKDNLLKENKAYINNLKKDKKEKEVIICTYKNLIDNYKKTSYNENNNNNLKEEKLKKYHENKLKIKDLFECKFCTGKYFISEEALTKHIIKRHDTLKKDTFNTEKQDLVNMSFVDNKIKDLNDNFEKYIKSITQPMFELINTQKDFEFKLYNFQNETKMDKIHIENELKSTLLEIKNMYINHKNIIDGNIDNNSNYNIKRINNQEINNTKSESEIKNEEELKKLTNALSSVKTQLENIKKEQKINKFKEEKEKKEKKSIIEKYEKELKKANELNKNCTENNNLKIIKNNNEDFMKTDTAKHNNAIEKADISKDKYGNININNKFVESKQDEINVLRNSENINNNESYNILSNKQNIKSKINFNAGPIESDHSDDEYINKNISNKISNILENEKSRKSSYSEVKVDNINVGAIKKENKLVNFKGNNTSNNLKNNSSNNNNNIKVQNINKKLDNSINSKSNISDNKNKSSTKENETSNFLEAKKTLTNGFNNFMARDENFSETFKKDYYKTIS